MSACDTCRQPGACCMGFALSKPESEMTFWDGDTRDQIEADIAARGLPFRTIAKRETYKTDDDRTYSTWYWGCPRLGADGRCTDYKNRPQLCHDYQAEQDPLCVEFKGIPVVSA